VNDYIISRLYLSYSLLCGLAGSALGNLLGILIIPKVMMDTYKLLYTFPEIKLSGYWWYVVISTLVVVLFGIIASLLSVTKTLKEVPAQCMRPIAPKKIHKTWLEKREKLWSKISYKNKFLLRLKKSIKLGSKKEKSFGVKFHIKIN